MVYNMLVTMFLFLNYIDFYFDVLRLQKYIIFFLFCFKLVRNPYMLLLLVSCCK